jgi:hypothetical protein
MIEGAGEHFPEKAGPGLDPGVDTGFPYENATGKQSQYLAPTP